MCHRKSAPSDAVAIDLILFLAGAIITHLRAIIHSVSPSFYCCWQSAALTLRLASS
jgi:hypothetical protein